MKWPGQQAGSLAAGRAGLEQDGGQVGEHGGAPGQLRHDQHQIGLSQAGGEQGQGGEAGGGGQLAVEEEFQ